MNAASLSLWLTVLLTVTGCLKRPSTTAAVAEAGVLTLSGQVTDASGAGQQGVRIFVDTATESAGITDATGQYHIVLAAEELSSGAAAATSANATFSLFFEAVAANGTSVNAVARSDAVAWSDRGDRDLGTVALGAAATVKGKVLTLDGGRQPLPATQATLRMGRARLTTDAEGAFVVNGLPAGTLTLTASSPRLANAARDLTLAAGETRTLDRPLILFPETGLAGVLVAMPGLDQGQLILSGHPFLRSFQVIASKDVTLLRYHHDAAALLNADVAPWRPLTERIDYDFPRDGGQVLYFQFTNDARDTVSEIYSTVVILDQFAGHRGFTVEDGSGRVQRRDIVLNIDIPPAAHRMRVAESANGLEDRPWQVPTPVFPYTLQLERNDLDLPIGFGLRTIYVQFIDALGFLSPVYKQTVTLDLFPPTIATVFTIDAGAAIAQSRLVRLDIQVPVNAYEMRVFERDDSSDYDDDDDDDEEYSSFFSTTNVWLAARPYMFWTFRKPGMKTIYLQFRGLDGSVSPVYQQHIRVDPFPDYAVGFEINGGAPTSASRYLNITLVPPVSAVSFRIFETTTGNTGSSTSSSSLNSVLQNPWITLMPQFTYEAKGTGARTVFVVYRTLDGDQSPAFIQTVYIEPFVAGSGDMIINGGAPGAVLPTLDVTIVPPPNAIAMALTEGTLPLENNIVWLELAPSVPWTVYGTGAKTLFLRFKGADGTISPAIQKTIFYEPFPYGTAGVSIDGGAATTADTEVSLTFSGLPNLLKMRYAATPEALLLQPLQEFVTTSTYILPTADVGTHKVYVQFATATGELSPVFTDEIRYQP